MLDLIPIERGYSGRIIKLKIDGDKKSLIIGKELEIRKTLSPTHLYSSAFYITKEEIINKIPQRFILKGAGWGHGVGLCQIGAAVMSELGYGFDEILTHYFKNSVICKIY
jgi:SpoIID/LytB domain protein